MERNNKYFCNDLKLQGFLRLMSPSSFIGIDKSDPRKVLFVFINSSELLEIVRGYFSGKEYLISPLNFGNHIDQGKDLIFGNIEF